MDPNHPTVTYCSEGMKAEAEGRLDDAQRLFAQAWQARTDDYYASVAAHFVARQQPTPEGALHWNTLALIHANAVGDDRVLTFYPSLYLNIAHSHERLGDLSEAGRFYQLAATTLDNQLPGPLGDLVRQGVKDGLRRIAEQTGNDGTTQQLSALD